MIRLMLVACLLCFSLESTGGEIVTPAALLKKIKARDVPDDMKIKLITGVLSKGIVFSPEQSVEALEYINLLDKKGNEKLIVAILPLLYSPDGVYSEYLVRRAEKSIGLLLDKYFEFNPERFDRYFQILLNIYQHAPSQKYKYQENLYNVLHKYIVAKNSEKLLAFYLKRRTFVSLLLNKFYHVNDEIASSLRVDIYNFLYQKFLASDNKNGLQAYLLSFIPGELYFPFKFDKHGIEKLVTIRGKSSDERSTKYANEILKKIFHSDKEVTSQDVAKWNKLGGWDYLTSLLKNMPSDKKSWIFAHLALLAVFNQGDSIKAIQKYEGLLADDKYVNDIQSREAFYFWIIVASGCSNDKAFCQYALEWISSKRHDLSNKNLFLLSKAILYQFPKIEHSQLSKCISLTAEELKNRTPLLLKSNSLRLAKAYANIGYQKKAARIFLMF